MKKIYILIICYYASPVLGVVLPKRLKGHIYDAKYQ